MILIHGEIIDSGTEEKYLEGLFEECLKTISKSGFLTKEKVINACDALYHKVKDGEYDGFIRKVLSDASVSPERFAAMAGMFTRESLMYKCQTELGEDFEKLSSLPSGIKHKLYPLGILLHIAAGNVDALPAYSVIEGLLAGNINILKLPAGDNGLSIFLLSELIKLEPDLKDYIYVFDVPSTDVVSMNRLADMADGIVIWGGDEAVQAVRNLVDVRTKIIEWGHKLSFAYVTEQVEDQDLYELALHVCETNQMYCSSCQGIFVDTQKEEVLHRIGKRFLEHLGTVAKKNGQQSLSIRGKNRIRLYADMLEPELENKIYQKEGVSVTVKDDSELELSYLFRNVWIKALPREQIICKLKKHKGHLQTCGLLCEEKDREELCGLLAKAGVVRITKGDMSRTVAGEAHDGRYSLREYVRIVEYT